LLQSLTLGNQTFPINLIQGPLAGVSCSPFRALTWQYGRPAFSCTEMISCKTILHQSDTALRRFVQRDPDEGPVCFQLSGSNPIELGDAVKKVTQLGADLIDLNCGCPVKKIRSRGAGSSLLTNTMTLYQLITAMKTSTHLPVSIKIRVEGNSGDRFNREVAAVVRDAGADFLVVHGRHWTEHYETPCKHSEIAFFVDELSIPVIGNGDVTDLTSLQQMFATGCAGVMIGRAGVGQPWLVAKLAAEIRGENFTSPSLREIGAIFMTHVIKLSELLNSEKFAIIQARKFAKYYGRELVQRTAFNAEVNECESLKKLQEICHQFFI
jgi:tRNA-dihydrouridine synthase B